MQAYLRSMRALFGRRPTCNEVYEMGPGRGEEAIRHQSALLRSMNCQGFPSWVGSTGTIHADVRRAEAFDWSGVGGGGGAVTTPDVQTVQVPRLPGGGPPESNQPPQSGISARPRVKDWGQSSLTTSAGDVLRMAQNDNVKWTNVAHANPSAADRVILLGYSGNANWAGYDSEGGKWEIPGSGVGPDSVYEIDVDILASTAANQVGLENGQRPVNPEGTPVGKVSTGVRGLAGIPAFIHSVWKCPTGYVQGDHGMFTSDEANGMAPTSVAGGIAPMCFDKNILPDKFKENRPKPAPVSFSDAQNIRKAQTAVNRIDRYAKKKVYKTKRSPRRETTHYHHTHRR